MQSRILYEGHLIYHLTSYLSKPFDISQKQFVGGYLNLQKTDLFIVLFRIMPLLVILHFQAILEKKNIKIYHFQQLVQTFFFESLHSNSQIRLPSGIIYLQIHFPLYSFHFLYRIIHQTYLPYNSFSKMKQSKCKNFAVKLQYILDNSTFDSIICWSDKNTVIEILDPLGMEKQILPVYFRQSKYESFVRQLNLYGFKKMKCHSSNKFTHQLLRQGWKLSSISTIKKAQKKTEEEEKGMVNIEYKCKSSNGCANESLGEMQNNNKGIDRPCVQNVSNHTQNASNHVSENVINACQTSHFLILSLGSSIVYIPAEQYLLWNYIYNMQAN